MEIITLVDIIKSTTLTKTIWKQELKCTKDWETLCTLLDSYHKVVDENFNNYRMKNCEMKYKDFYDKVLNKFEEML